MKHDSIIGIDPGMSNGGICLKRDHIQTWRVPREFPNMNKLFNYMAEISVSPLAFIEVVQMFNTDSKTPGKAFGMKKLFDNFTSLKNALSANNIPYVPVYPISWQTYLKLKIKEPETDKDRKNRYKTAAQNLFPGHKVTLWNSDAILLTHFGSKKLVLDPEWIYKRLINNQKSML